MDKILSIRLQALGDVVITLPYLNELRAKFPLAQLDLLTREETGDIPIYSGIFSNVFIVKNNRSNFLLWIRLLALLPRLYREKYRIIFDLQNSRITRFIVYVLKPVSHYFFDRFSLMPAGYRVSKVFRDAGMSLEGQIGFRLKNFSVAKTLLELRGWTGEEFVVLNPGGCFPSKNWSLASFSEVGRRWLSNPGRLVVLLGSQRNQSRNEPLARAIGDGVLNLTGHTSVSEAYSILQLGKGLLTEDSGLMHMAWVGGVPTFVLFGSTRSVWSRPLGKRSRYLDSLDLPCGECLQSICPLGTTHCLVRWSVDEVYSLFMELIKDE